MTLLLLSMFMATPAPLDMPRAEAYIVKEGNATRLEDRYDRLDLWISQAVLGRWFDDDGRSFVLSRLDVEPPVQDSHGTVTRCDYADTRVRMKRIRVNASIPTEFRQAISLLSPSAIAERPRPPRQLPRGFKDVDYWQHQTNRTDIICAFRPEKSEIWYLASWQLVDGDDYSERMQSFEDEFLGKEFWKLKGIGDPFKGKEAGERELLRDDVRRSVVAYDGWHFTDSPEFAVIDDLAVRDFMVSLTNEFATMRSRYAETVPTSIDGSNVLAVARIYASRDEYLDALEADGHVNMEWSAAYWSSERRELVAHLSKGGETELLKTFRHEAFHQYLSYAASMISVSPWLNEGYAQYFEDPEALAWDFDLTPEIVEKLSASIPGVLSLDYAGFYSGTDAERHSKYRLAWSLAVFLEKGADKVRFQPFKDLKKRYFAELFVSHDMRKATAAAFKSEDGMKLFISEWRKFWCNR